MVRTTRRIRLAALAALGGALTLAGCSVANPITTAEPYAPSDGVRVAVTDELTVVNLMILTEGEGKPGHLLGAVVNRSQDDVEVTFTIGEGGANVPVQVDAGETVNFADAGITTQSVDAAPGSTVPATVSTPTAGDVAAQIPVLDGTLPPYDKYLEQAS